MRLNVRNSRTATALTETAARLGRALSSASVATVARRTQTLASTAFADSIAGRFVRWSSRAVRTSWLFRWLTAEPEPDVIVIDLRKTAIIGPLLGVLDWLLARVFTSLDSSLVSAVADRLLGVFRARPLQAASTLMLGVIVANLGLTVVRGTPSTGAIGVRLLAMSLALAGTRLTHSADDLTETGTYAVLVALLEPPAQPDASADDREED